ncbi:hypothetical protein RHSIM_Rhsim09G0074500 [Rhododendron simsii]|uniref:Uncharacterized protein n=1 Tax=Rhododendron simsii TaxID=118357 RepID=A0A834GJ88_RHOSS|nr:hypothetical protein RHSIM_Rhsim09G0074500 [Rhododendron simsii]
METDGESFSTKSHGSKFPNDYLCIRCGKEVKFGEATIAKKEHKSAFSKSRIRFNTMGGNLVVLAKPGVPSYHDLEAVGYQFPSQGRYLNHRGAEGWYTKISTSHKRRLQRKFASRVYDGHLDPVNDPIRLVANMVWTRESGESNISKEVAPKHGGQIRKRGAAPAKGQDQQGKGAEMEIYWADPSPVQAETNNVEANLYDESLWPLEMEDVEAKSFGARMTEGQFLKYFKEGFRRISKDFHRLSIVSRPAEAKFDIFNV